MPTAFIAEARIIHKPQDQFIMDLPCPPKHPDVYTVEIHWAAPAVDRPHTSGISCGGGPKGKALAARLAAAVNAQAVHKNLHVKADAAGRSFVCGDCLVWGKQLSADLKRLGF
jgi:hypothetical protein